MLKPVYWLYYFAHILLSSPPGLLGFALIVAPCTDDQPMKAQHNAGI